jgi:hypothetical protein
MTKVVTQMRRTSVLFLAALAVSPLIGQDKTPANLTFRDGGQTKHYDGIIFDSDTSGGPFF